MAGKLFTLIKKNYQLLLRTHSSALIIIFGPLILIVVVGLAFNTANAYSIRIATFSERYSPLTDSLISNLEKQHYTVLKADSKDSCISSLKGSVVNVCAIFPQDLDQHKEAEIVFYVDNTKLNLVYAVVDTISATVETKSKELSTQLIKAVVDTIDRTQRKLADKGSLVTQIKNVNGEADNQIQEALTKLSSMNIAFDPSELPLVSIENLLEVNAANNSDATIVLNRLTGELNTLKNKVDTANNARSDVIAALNSAKAIINTNQNYATTLEETFKNIIEEIDNTKQTGIGKIVAPLSTRIEPITPQKTSLSYIFPTLLVLIITFVSMLLASALEIRERSAKTYFKNFITPTKAGTFILANFLTNLSIVIVQMFVLLMAAVIFFRDQLSPLLWSLILSLIIIASVFLLLGMLIGTIFRSEETGMIAVVSLSFVLLFFSGTLLPIETMPSIVRSAVSFNPFYASHTILNKLLLMQAPLTTILPSFYMLLGTIALLLVLVCIARSAAQKGF